jgi:hypothetical protein
MVSTQSEPAEIPQHMFVQILVQVGKDRQVGGSIASDAEKLAKPFAL